MPHKENIIRKWPLELPDVTLFGLDTIDPDRTAKVLMYHRRWFNPLRTVLISDRAPTLKSPLYSYYIIDDVYDYASAMSFEVKRLIDFCDTKYLWYVSHDGFVIDPSRWNPEFLDYDMIGAPWPNKFLPEGGRHLMVGNTGFCIRSRRFLRMVYEMSNGHHFKAGDVFACQTLGPALMRRGLNFAPPQLAYEFSRENEIEGLLPCRHFGGHGAYPLGMVDFNRMNAP